MTRLTYHDGQPVHLGDSVSVRRFLRVTFTATVDYLSGESVVHPELEVAGLVTVAMQRPNGTLMAWNHPSGTALSHRFRLASRGRSAAPVRPSDEIL